MNLVYLEEVGSTNQYAKENIDKFEDKTVIYTYNQTNGRGRLDRKWSYTGADNIYASIILKPSEDMKEVYSNLTQYLCVVLCETFEEYRVSTSRQDSGNDVKPVITPNIKWPNDIKINNKKISGILAESSIHSGKLQGLVLGFGINLNTKIEILSKINQPATSLNIEIGREVDKKIFLKKLLDKFFLRYDNFIEEGFPLIRKDYIRRANFLNKEVTVKVFDIEISGIAKDITRNGALKLVDKNNNEHVLLIGDIL